MVCYPIILLIAGLNQQDTSNVFKKSIKNLAENCNENFKKSVNLPTPLPTNLYKAVHLPSYLDKETKYYDSKDDLGSIKYDDAKDTIMTPFTVIKNNWKKYIKNTDIPVAEKQKNVEYGEDITPLLLSKNSLNNKSFINVGSKDPEKDVENIKPNLQIKMITNKPANMKKHVRIGKPIPTIEDTNDLIRSFKDGSSFVVISDKYLKRLTNMADFEQNPSFSRLNLEESERRAKYYEVSADYLAKLIVENIHKVKETGSELFRQIVQEFRRVIEAALEYIETRNLENGRLSYWQN